MGGPSTLLLLIAAGSLWGAQDESRLLVYAPEPFHAALEPLVALRESEGWTCSVADASAQGLGDALGALAGAPDAILLVGDQAAGAEDEPWHVPSHSAELYRWRSVQRERFSSDPLLGDLDGDGSIDVPVGRIPARSAADVERAVAKILAWEQRAPSLADLRLVAWGGAPGYGGAIDKMATGMLVGMVTKQAPAWAEPWLLSAAANEPLCGHPPDHPSAFSDAVNAGALLCTMVAHADAQHVVSMRHGSETIAYDASDARAAFADGEPTAPLVFLTCESGRFDGGEECLAETMFALPGGPVATIGATTESHPLPNYFTGLALLQELAAAAESDGTARIGAYWLAAQRRGAAARSMLVERMLADAEGSLAPEIDVAQLRRDQQRIYALLGDPLTSLRVPRPLAIAVEPDGEGSGWRWSVDPALRTEGAQLFVSLRPARAEKQDELPDDASIEERRAAFERANAAYRFEPLATLDAGADWGGRVDRPGRLRAVLVGPQTFAAGTAELKRARGE